jgi:hypothetical protein
MSFAKMLSSRVTSKLIGKQTWPKLTIEDDELSNEYFQAIIKNAKLRSRLLEPMRRNLGSGAVFVRFAIIAGRWKFEHFLSKYCFLRGQGRPGREEKAKIEVVQKGLWDADRYPFQACGVQGRR